MNILDRLEKIQQDNRLKKREFEEIIGKSSGYVNTLRKNSSIPGTDVIIKIAEKFPEYSLKWILLGIGEIKNSDKTENILMEPVQIYAEKVPEKQIEDVAYGINRRFDDVERALKIIMLDISEVKLKADSIDSEKFKKAFDDLGELKSRV